MYNFILVLIVAICYSSNINNQLLDLLYRDTDWILDETLDNGSKIYIKNIDNISLKAIKISQDVEIDPIKIINIIKDINNYNLILQSSSNVITTPINSSNDIIAKQSISIPIFSDLYYFFKIYESNNKVYWLLQDPSQYSEIHSSGFALSIGCGGWDYTQKKNGQYTINYRLIFDIDSYPNWVVNYINYYSLLNVYNDVINAAKNDKN